MPPPLPFVLLHYFGSSRREWDLVAARLGTDRRVVAIDLPGFGDRASEPAADVSAMADAVDRDIRAAGLDECILVGHSMSAKVAAVLTARGPRYVRGLVLVSASPPSPEPISDASRQQLMAFDGSRGAAEEYVDGITAKRLPDALREIAIADAMRASPEAWRDWVTKGSQEDCASTVGQLWLPVLVIAGEQDQSLGPSVQQASTMPHVLLATLRVIAGGHLLPLENPTALHAELELFADELETPVESMRDAGSERRFAGS